MILKTKNTKNPPSEAAPKPKRRLLKITLATVIIVIVIGAFTLWWFYRPQETPSVPQGAYARYSGTTTIPPLSINMTIRLEEAEHNSTYAKLLTYVKIEISQTEPQELQNITWVDLRTKTYEFQGSAPTETHEDYVDFQGLGTRQCIIQTYSEGDTSWTLYVDKNIGWPLKMEFSESGMSFELTLVETNISGLK
jgi:hypothetical protein